MNLCCNSVANKVYQKFFQWVFILNANDRKEQLSSVKKIEMLLTIQRNPGPFCDVIYCIQHTLINYNTKLELFLHMKRLAKDDEHQMRAEEGNRDAFEILILHVPRMTCFVILCFRIHSNTCYIWAVLKQSSPLSKDLRDDSLVKRSVTILIIAAKEPVYSLVESKSRSAQEDCQESNDGNNNGTD